MFKKLFGKAPPIEFGSAGLPSNVMELIGTKQQGPNCWNATMLFFDPNRSIRYVTPEEMTEWLEHNTYRDEYKFCAVGSIIVLYQDNTLIHTAIFVAPGILFHKRGCAGHWEFVTEKQLRSIYSETTRYDYRLYKSI